LRLGDPSGERPRDEEPETSLTPGA